MIFRLMPEQRAWKELNYENLKWNVERLKELLPEHCAFMAVVKADAQFGYSEISLGVNCDNHAAYRLYLNNGFFVFETARDEYGKYYKMLKNVKGSDMNVEPQGNAGHYDQKAPAQRDQGK